jgi:excisionase family DNA binding protein
MLSNLRSFPHAKPPAKIRALELYHTIRQVAERLHAGESTVKRWISTGRLRPTKIGDRTLVTETDLQAFVRACNPGQEAPR